MSNKHFQKHIVFTRNQGNENENITLLEVKILPNSMLKFLFLHIFTNSWQTVTISQLLGLQVAFWDCHSYPSGIQPFSNQYAVLFFCAEPVIVQPIDSLSPVTAWPLGDCGATCGRQVEWQCCAAPTCAERLLLLSPCHSDGEASTCQVVRPQDGTLSDQVLLRLWMQCEKQHLFG